VKLVLDYAPIWLFQKLANVMEAFNVVENWEWSHGLYKLRNEDNTLQRYETRSKSIQLGKQPSSSFLYVNKGIGSPMGLRVNCNPEIAYFTFQATEK